MKINKYIFLFLLTFFVFTNIVKANEGVVYSPRECYGITYGTHSNHWHQAIQNGNEYIAQGEPIYTYPCNPSNDPTLKSVTVNNNAVVINDKMEIKTYESEATINVIPNYQYAKTEYEKEKKLNIGNNTITIKITTSLGIVKTYELNIIREKILSTNNNIKEITIDGKQYQFQNNTIENLFVTSNHKKLKIDVITEDETAKIIIKNNDNLKTGDNTITIICQAENGQTQNYYIKLYKSRVITDIVGVAIGILILLSPLIIIIIIFTRKNRKKYINNSHYYKRKI